MLPFKKAFNKNRQTSLKSKRAIKVKPNILQQNNNGNNVFEKEKIH